MRVVRGILVSFRTWQDFKVPFFYSSQTQSQRGELWGCLVVGLDTLGRPEVSASSCDTLGRPEVSACLFSYSCHCVMSRE